MAGNFTKPSPGPAQDIVTNDELLVERFKAGDAWAFDQIVEEYCSRVAMLANLLLGLLGLGGSVEDVGQDVFLSVHRLTSGTIVMLKACNKKVASCRRL